jgi:transmembrane sensor
VSDYRLPVEVEPPSEQRWDRIGREMFAKLDASAPPAAAPERMRGGWGRYALAGSVAALAVAAAVVVVVRSTHEESDTRSRLETADGVSRFTIGESFLVVAPRSLVMVGGDDEHGVDVSLDRGAITCVVAPRHGRPPFLVDAGDVRVRVVGTKFSVARNDAGVSVDVDHGVVEIVAKGTVVTLHDGERWPAVAEVPAGNAVPAGNEVPGGNVPAAPSPTESASSSASLPIAEPPTSVARPRGELTRPSSGLIVTEPPADWSAPARSSAVVPPQAAAAPAPTMQSRFEEATKMERTRPADAMAIYREVAASGSAWAPTALFALARLEAEQSRGADAKRHLNEYLTRYPRGVNADDARALLQRMQ